MNKLQPEPCSNCNKSIVKNSSKNEHCQCYWLVSLTNKTTSLSDIEADQDQAISDSEKRFSKAWNKRNGW